MQNISSQTHSSAVVSRVFGALFMTFFGIVWALLTLQGLNNLAIVFLLIIAGVVTVVLLAICISFLRAARRLPREDMSPEAQAQAKTVSRRFGLVFGIEIVAIAAANTLLGIVNHAEFIAPVMGLTVGLHFLPLAALFQERIYYLTGAVLSLLGVIAILALLMSITLGGLYTWSVIVGLSNAAILWLTTVYILAVTRHALQQSTSASLSPSQH